MPFPLTPRRRAASVLLLSTLFLALITAALAPGSFFAQDKAGGQNLPPELAVVPPDAFAFVQIRPADLWSSDLVAKLRKHVPAEAIGALTSMVDPADLESVAFVAPTAASIPKFFGGSPKPVEKIDEKPSDKKPAEPSKESSPVSLVATQPGEPEAVVLLIFTTTKPYDQEKAKKLLGLGPIEEQKHKEKTFFVGARKSALWFLNDKTYVLAFSETAPFNPPGKKAPPLMKQIIDRPEQARAQGPLAGALDLAMKKEHQVVAGVNLMDPLMQKEMKSALAQMNQPWRTEPFWAIAPLISTRTALLALKVKEAGVQVEASFAYSDPERAEEALGAVQDTLAIARIFTLGRMNHELRTAVADGDASLDEHLMYLLLKQAESALRKATVERRLATVQVQAQTQLDVDALEAQAKEAAKAAAKGEDHISRRALTESRNNIKQLMLAWMLVTDVYRVMPPRTICSKTDGKELLSWRVALLPYLEQGALYKEFKLDEPWDSEHNIKLLPRMPKLYAPVRGKTKEPYSTYYQAFAGKDTAFETYPDKTALWGALGNRFPGAFSDGTTQIIGIVEAGEAVPWTKPADVEYDSKKPLPKLGGMFNGAFHVGAMDASARFFKGVAAEGVEPKDVPPGFISQQTLRRAIIRNDGLPLGPDW